MTAVQLKALRDWWNKHGGSGYRDADEWINSLTNVELIERLCRFDPMNGQPIQ